MNAYENLVPALIFPAIEQQGFRPTGALFPLNSYENRVYEMPLETGERIVAKFYRPGRWSAETIAEEHRFLWAAAELEIPTVPPLRLPQPTAHSESLGLSEGYYFALYPKFRGREEAEHDAEKLRWLGRTLARLHNLGDHFTSRHRMALTPQTYGHDNIPLILALDCIPAAQRTGLESLLPQAIALAERIYNIGWPMIPLHGDCHHGNVLWNLDGPHLLDFDDMVVAPAIQDAWMLFSGTAAEQHEQRQAFLEGYTIFRTFDERSWILAEPLRTLRVIRHAAWLATRYLEPAFQRAFPYFTESRYWEAFTQDIREQISLLQEL